MAHYPYSPEDRASYAVAKKELYDMGDKGVDVIEQAAASGALAPHNAIELLGENPSERSVQVLESWLEPGLRVPKIVGTGHLFSVVQMLGRKDRASSIAPIVRAAERVGADMQMALETKSEHLDFSEVSGEFYDLEAIINALQSFSDREGLRQAEALYETHNTLRAKYEQWRASIVGTRLPQFIRREDLALQFEMPTAEQEREMRQLLEAAALQQEVAEFVEEEVGAYGVPADVEAEQWKAFGDAAIPFLHHAMIGEFDKRHVLRLLETFPPEKVAPVYCDILLRSADGGGFLPDSEVLNALSASDAPEAVKTVAEYVRQVAERTVNEPRHYPERGEPEMSNRVRAAWGLKALRDWTGKLYQEAYRARRMLSASYAELGFSYADAPHEIRQIERPLSKERKAWKHSKLFIRGSALFASLLGRGKEKVRDVDIFLTIPDHEAAVESARVEYFTSVDDIRPLIAEDEFAKLKNWVEEAGFGDKKINLVRIPESHQSLEESFIDEPKLLLWSADPRDTPRVIARHISAQRAFEMEASGNPGEIYFPEILTPNGSLTRALRLMDLAERFELNCDKTFLEHAEKLAREGQLIVSAFPYGRSSVALYHELQGQPVIDPTFIKVFEDKSMRKTLLREYPRLGQVAESVAAAGGPEEFMKRNFGEAYITTRGFVYLYDIDLSQSPAAQERQKRFIEQWYSKLATKQFSVTEVQKVSDKPDVPKPEYFARLVDQEKLGDAVRRRASSAKRTFLEKAAGRYKLRVTGNEALELKEKVASYLEVMNMGWPAELPMEKAKVAQTLIRLGVHPKNPILGQFDNMQEHEVELAVSADPLDVLQISTDKPWSSCTNLNNGAYQLGPYEDIATASVVAYILKDNKFIARKLIRAGMTLEDFEPAAAIEKLYGDGRYEPAMWDALKQLLNERGIKTETPMMTFPFSEGVYFDSSTGQTSAGNHFYYTKQVY